MENDYEGTPAPTRMDGILMFYDKETGRQYFQIDVPADPAHQERID